ncbi:MAG: hypothetical protein EBU11_09250 [Gammaproteobacteria bacterium]|nr:hypothetical protein [Gammaproteobacteria bacterium]
MDISLSLCSLFIPKETFLRSPARENALSSTFNLAARTAVVQYCKRPTWRSLLTFLAHPLSFGKWHQRSRGAGHVDAAAITETAMRKVATRHNFAYSSGSFGGRFQVRWNA